MALHRLLITVRAWWFLRIAKNARPPADVRRYLMERGMKQLEGTNLSPEVQKSIAVEQIAAVCDGSGDFDGIAGDVLVDAFGRLVQAQNAIENRKQQVIAEGAAAGRSISTEAVLKHVLNLKSTYSRPDREEYIREIDRFVDDFRQRHGPLIPVDQAYAMLKDIEEKYGRVE